MKETRDPETYAVLGAAMEVHRELGHGFLEIVHQTAMALESAERRIACQAEVPLPIRYKAKLLTCSYRADFICFETGLAISQLAGADQAHVMNALKATGLMRALLIDFGTTSLQYERLAFDPDVSSNLRKSAKSADEIFL